MVKQIMIHGNKIKEPLVLMCLICFFLEWQYTRCFFFCFIFGHIKRWMSVVSAQLHLIYHLNWMAQISHWEPPSQWSSEHGASKWMSCVFFGLCTSKNENLLTFRHLIVWFFVYLCMFARECIFLCLLSNANEPLCSFNLWSIKQRSDKNAKNMAKYLVCMVQTLQSSNRQRRRKKKSRDTAWYLKFVYILVHGKYSQRTDCSTDVLDDGIYVESYRT